MAKKEQTKISAAKSTKKPSKAASSKKASVKKSAVNAAPKQLRLIRHDEWLQPFAGAIEGRHQHVLDKLAELTNGGKQKLTDFATGYLYFGLHFENKKWVLREWAPNATAIYVIGEFNDWKQVANKPKLFSTAVERIFFIKKLIWKKSEKL